MAPHPTTYRDTTFAFIDVETTGLNPQRDRVVEVACVIARGGRRLDTLTSLVDPECPIPATASAVHHLTDESVRGAPTIRALAPWLTAFVADAVIVAHNASFDLDFLPFLRARPAVCAMRLAQRLLPEAPNYKNQVLRYHLGIRDPALANVVTHRALGDALVTSLVFDACLQRFLAAGGPDDMPLLIAQMAPRAPRRSSTLPFGRYRNTPLAEIPSDYLHWLIHAASPSPNIRSIVEAELNGRRAGRAEVA